MGSVSSFVSNVLNSTAPGLITDIASQTLKTAQQNQADRAQAKAQAAKDQQALNEAQAKADKQRADLLTQASRTQADKQTALQKALSKARTYFGAQGIDPNSGSAAVIQQTESNDAATQAAQDNADLQSNLAAIDQQLQTVQQRNLLDQSLLRQKQKLRNWFA